MNIMKEVYAIFGKDCPTRSLYSATRGIPVPARVIMKEFKTWAKFKIAYNIYVIQLNQKTENLVEKKSEKKVVEDKPAKKTFKKKTEVTNVEKDV